MSEPNTHFAPAGRVSITEARQAAGRVSTDPVVTMLLRAYGGLVAIVNEQRQILVVNEGLLSFLGIEDAGECLGLRPGEAVKCVHAADGPDGCGTGTFCRTCGAAIALVLAAEEDAPQTRECLLTARSDDGELAMELLVRAVPFRLDGERVIALLLQDIRAEKRRQALERIFFHDVRNTITGIVGISRHLALEAGNSETAESLRCLSTRLADEVEAQQILLAIEAGEYRDRKRRVKLSEVLQHLRDVFCYHTVSQDRTFGIEPVEGEDRLLSLDAALLERVLVNMVRNAFEATPEGGVVRLFARAGADGVSFRVWNEGCIPEEAAMRIFQRYFSTKGEPGRGLGTYSMKLLGEQYLGGSIRFTTSLEEGTEFVFSLPADVVAG